MVTHFRVGTNRPTERLNLHVSSVSPLPKSYRDAFSDPNWQNAMRDEYSALIKNRTWVLVPRPTNTNIVLVLAFSTISHLADARYRYKARLSAECLASSRHWPIHQLDVKNAILHGDLSKTVYMQQPPGFRDSKYPDHKKYAVEILERAHMANCNPCRTPVDTESKLGNDGDPHRTGNKFVLIADPREPHLSALKRILRYVQGTLNYGLQLFSSSTTDLVAYSDADWAGCPHDSEIDFSKYRGIANGLQDGWLRNLLRELHTPLSSATLVYCDNVSAVYLSSNPVQHQRTKHIEIDIHFVRDLVAAGQVRVLHVPSRYQFADIFTKGLPSALFEEFRTSLSVRCPPAPTAGEYVAHMNNDPFFGISIPENNFEASSSSDVLPTVVHTAAPNSEHVTKWTKDHTLDNIIGELERPVSTRLQLHEKALFCFYDAFLTSVEPKNYKDALTQACWIEAMQEELNEFEHLKVWELISRPNKVMVITLK
ncbi:ribonuclease H-like domain-containing protein [Tanacetum coccineum]